METSKDLYSIATSFPFIKGLFCIVLWFLCSIDKECFQFHIFWLLASRISDYYLADNRDFHCLAFSSHCWFFPSPESSWAGSCYPGYSFLCFVLLVGFGVGFLPGGGGVVWRGAGNPQSRFLVFFLRLSKLFYFITFSNFDGFRYSSECPPSLICSSPSKHERNFHTLSECLN